MPVQVLRARWWERWVLAALAAVPVLQQYVLWAANAREVDYINILIFLGFLGLVVERRSRLTVLTGPVLRLGRWLGEDVIPLAAAEVKPLTTGWQIRWNDGRTVRRLSVVTPRAFQEAVERAAEQAGAALPGEVPRTPREAVQAVPCLLRTAARTRAAGFVLVIVLLVLLSVWLDHPGLLFGVPVLYWFHDRIFAGTTLVLCDRTLWFLSNQGPMYQVPLDRIRSVEPIGRRQVLLHLDDPRYPALKLVRRRSFRCGTCDRRTGGRCSDRRTGDRRAGSRRHDGRPGRSGGVPPLCPLRPACAGKSGAGSRTHLRPVPAQSAL